MLLCHVVNFLFDPNPAFEAWLAVFAFVRFSVKTKIPGLGAFINFNGLGSVIRHILSCFSYFRNHANEGEEA